jgi:hypothetical protein
MSEAIKKGRGIAPALSAKRFPLRNRLSNLFFQIRDFNLKSRNPLIHATLPLSRNLVLRSRDRRHINPNIRRHPDQRDRRRLARKQHLGPQMDGDPHH